MIFIIGFSRFLLKNLYFCREFLRNLPFLKNMANFTTLIFMKLIIDSGSTKSDLLWISKEKHFSEQTSGINPFLQDSEEIARLLSQLPLHKEETSEIFFYGAGCTPSKKFVVEYALQTLFPDSLVNVESDLLGAARSLFGKEKGIACILGTGSNSCEYDGSKIIKNVSPLGYILGDEGSGAVIGKHFVGDLLKGICPEQITIRFFEEEMLSSEEIMERIYKKTFPNRFLAQLTKHIFRHKDEEYFQSLLCENFDRFFQRNIRQYTPSLPIRCIGSVAFYFQEELKRSATRNGFEISRICQSPMEGLAEHHKNW